MDLVSGPVAVGALAELIAAGLAGASGQIWRSVRGSSEARAIRSAATAALAGSLSDATLTDTAPEEDGWVEEVAKLWRSAFTEKVVAELVTCLADTSGEASAQFAELARAALLGSGCDLGTLGRTFWVEEFLAVLPRRLLAELRDAALKDKGVRDLVGHLLAQREDARSDWQGPSTPGEFRRDVAALLAGLENWARAGRLPGYLPTDADIDGLTRTVRVRRGIRSVGDDSDADHESEAQDDAQDQAELVRPWPEIAAEERRLMVLADPGMGKSWLIRSETRRRCREALARLAKGERDGGVIPVPVRCDQLASVVGQDLPERAVAFLSRQGLLPDRSRAQLAAHIRAGKAILLLDALDELTAADDGPLRDMVREWAEQAGSRCRCVVTSRIAGYTGPVLPGACEVELQPFTVEDVAGVVSAWGLPRSSASELMDRARDPGIAAMTRIPLLLALMCAIAARPTRGQTLPRTRGQLLDRVLRWFLTRSHRSPDGPNPATLDDLSVGALLELLGPLAYGFACQPGGWVDLMTEDRLLQGIRAARPAFTDLGLPAAEVLRDLSIRAGVLLPAGDPSGGRSPGYLFFHRAVAEYLVARHLAGMAEPDWLAVVEEHLWFDPDWAEVIPMLGERLDPPAAARLVTRLLDPGPDPFHHSLLTAARVLGSRPDADSLLPAEPEAEFVGRLVRLMRHQSSRPAVVTRLQGMAYLPRPLLTQLLGLLGDPDREVQQAAAQTLANREGSGVAQALLKLLHDPASSTRWVAAQALADREGPEITRALLGLLDDPASGVRGTAAVVLAGREGPEVTRELVKLARHSADGKWEAAVKILASREGPDATEGLAGLIGDPEPRLRRAVTSALAGREGVQVTRALLAALADPESSVRGVAPSGLAGREGPEVTSALLTALADPESSVRGGAVRALAAREGPQVTQALLNALADPADSVRAAVGAALAGRRDPGLSAVLLGLLCSPAGSTRAVAAVALAGHMEAGVTHALIVALGDQDADVRRAAAATLAVRQGPEITRALLSLLEDHGNDLPPDSARAPVEQEGFALTTVLLGLLSNPHSDVREEAVRTLAGRDSWPCTPAIQGLLSVLGDPAHNVRETAAEILAGHEGPEVTQALLGLLSSAAPIMRQTAAETLAAREGQDVTRGLLSLVDRTSWGRDRWGRIVDNGRGQKAAGEALMARTRPEGTQALLRLLSHPLISVRRTATRVLAFWEQPQVTQALLELLNSTDFRTRESAARALESRNEAEVTQALLSLTGHPDWRARAAAAEALKSRSEAGVTRALLTLANDSFVSVRRAAAEGLKGREEPEVTRILLVLARDAASIVRRTAGQALAGREEPEVSRALLSLACDPVDTVRRAAVNSLANREGAEVAQTLADLAAHYEEAAVRALAKREDSASTEALVKILRTKYSEYNWFSWYRKTRHLAARALADREGSAATAALAGLLGDPDTYTRRIAARALAGREGPEITQALLEMLGDSDRFTRQAAAAELSTRNVAEDLAAWVKDNSVQEKIDLPTIVSVAERVMIRDYRRTNPAMKLQLRSDMAWLTDLVMPDQPS